MVMRCCTGGSSTDPLTDMDRRILADLADTDTRTRHTRSNLREWNDRARHLMARGLIEHGNPKDGKAHVVTEKGRKALETYGQSARQPARDVKGDEDDACA